MGDEPHGPIGVLEQVYVWLLAFFPREFRRRFVPEMLELFRARRASARRRGPAARVLFSLIAVTDLLRAAWRERRLARAATGPRRQWLPVTIVDDIRAAARRLRRSPALTLAVAGLLALAIGSATAVFGVVNAVLLRPLPYADPDRIMLVWETRANTRQNVVDGREFQEWATRTQTMASLAAIIYEEGLHLTDAGDPKAMLGVRVSASFFDVMGVAPAIGRAFTAAEDVEGHGQVAVLSDRLWRERFGGDRQAIGREIRLNDRVYSIIGVMPASFDFPPAGPRVTPDVWMPIAEPIERYVGRHYLVVAGRLKAGVTPAQAEAEIGSIARALAEAMPRFYRDHGVRVVPLHAFQVRDAKPSLLMLLGAVGCLLLIGCSNAASLLVARNLTRRREVGLELALGATRMRIVRQLLVESTGIAVVGGVLGIALAAGLTRFVPALVPPHLSGVDAIPIDGVVLAFAVGVSILTGVLFGTAPAMQVRRFGLADVLRRGGRGLAGGPQARLRRVLVSGQIALAVLLVLGAGLMIRGLIALHQVDPGFNTDRTLAVDLALRGSRYAQAARQRDFFERLEARLATTAGVASVGATSNALLSGSASGIAIALEGRPAPPPGQEPAAQYRVVSAGFFKTLHIPLLAGRSFTAEDARLAIPLIRWYPQQAFPSFFDQPQPPPVAVVNQAMAKAYWPGESPLGRRFRVLESPWITIVGVVADTHTVTLRAETGPEIYLSDLQEPQNSMTLLIRTSEAPADVVPAVRAVVQQIDPAMPITKIATMDEVVGAWFSQPRFTSTILAVFAAMALLLMTAGVYGLLAFTTAQRMPEMGVRIALGAPRAQIHRLVLRDGLLLAGIGVGVGLVVSVGASRLIADQLFGIPPTDVVTYLGVTVLVLMVVTVACWFPARRAARIDPIVVLRQE